ncbi:MAG: hypothetical protein IKK17_05865 [Oscillospiraceae bacterium]|nr:hypothetical protein [Oscillospiraceae bacterium]
MKRTFALLLVMVLLLSTVVYAVEPRGTVNPPSLSINNSVASCTYRFSADDSTDKVSVTLRLYRGQTLVNTWTGSGYGSVYMKKTANAVSGATYQLTANVYVNDSLVGSNSTTKYY